MLDSKHCTISNNTVSSYGFGGGIACRYCGALEITNSILWEDSAGTDPEIYVNPGSPTVTYSDVQGGWPGTGNIDSNPIFVGGGDYHLSSFSPCIDAGTDAGVYVDIDGDVRPLGAGFDMGADEVSGFQPIIFNLDVYYEAGILRLDYIIGVPEPTTWANYLVLTSPEIQVIPLWTVPLPAIDPPMEFPISFPFPQVGLIGIWTGLFTAGGPQAVELVWVDIGG